MYVRFQTGGGAESLSLGSASSNTGELFGNAVAVPLGNRPFYPGRKPPYRPNEPCFRQTPPDLNGPAAAKSLPTGQAALAAKKALPELRRKLRPFGSKEGVRR
jgi:phospholipid/cholesterol/gamma-HCH transport system substrate-binding protein